MIEKRKDGWWFEFEVFSRNTINTFGFLTICIEKESLDVYLAVGEGKIGGLARCKRDAEDCELAGMAFQEGLEAARIQATIGGMEDSADTLSVPSL